MKFVPVAILLIVFASHSNAESTWLCVAERAVGIKIDLKADSIVGATKYTADNKYLIKPSGFYYWGLESPVMPCKFENGIPDECIDEQRLINYNVQFYGTSAKSFVIRHLRAADNTPAGETAKTLEDALIAGTCTKLQ